MSIILKKILKFGLVLGVISVFSWLLLLYCSPHISFSSRITQQAFNALPAVIFSILVCLLLNRFLLALLLTGAIVKGLFMIHSMKISLLDQPLMFDDLFLIQMLFSAPELFLNYLNLKLSYIALFLSFILLVWACWHFERPIVRHWSVRALGIVSTASLLAYLFSPSALNAIYKDNFVGYKKNHPSHQDYFKRKIEKNGLMHYLVISAGDYFSYTPPTPDLGPIAEWIKENGDLKVEVPSLSAEDLPDIVMVLSESFMDLGIFRGVSECEETPNFCRIAARGETGFITTPVYGGITLRAEFEALTGISVNDNFPSARRNVYVNGMFKKVPSIASVLRSLGYETIVIHPNSANFWNRRRGTALLGFEKQIFLKDFVNPEKLGSFVSDSEIVSRIKNELTEDRPQFIFAITIENHGPWGNHSSINKRETVKSITAPQELTEELKVSWRDFVYRLRRADAYIAELDSFFSNRMRHTVFAYFGDHLPRLDATFESLGVDTRKETKYFIVDNRSVRPEKVDSDTTFLSAQILRRAGLSNDPFFRYTDILAEQLRTAEGLKQKKLKKALLNLQRYRMAEGELDPSVFSVAP